MNYPFRRARFRRSSCLLFSIELQSSKLLVAFDSPPARLYLAEKCGTESKKYLTQAFFYRYFHTHAQAGIAQLAER
jgi:hypothetical protein